MFKVARYKKILTTNDFAEYKNWVASVKHDGWQAIWIRNDLYTKSFKQTFRLPPRWRRARWCCIRPMTPGIMPTWTMGRATARAMSGQRCLRHVIGIRNSKARFGIKGVYFIIFIIQF